MSNPEQENKTLRGARASDRSLLLSIEKQVSTQLLEVLGKCLGSADDILFNEAEKPANSNHQTTFMAAMRELRIKKSEILVDYQKAINKSFQEIHLPKNAEKNKEGGSLDLSELSLVDEGQLELTMATDAIVNRCLRENEALIAAIDARFCCVAGQLPLVKEKDVEQSRLAEYNPVSPSRLRDFYDVSVMQIETELPVKIVLYKIYERKLLEKAQEIYESVNALFLRSSVLKDYIPKCLAKEDISTFKSNEERMETEPVASAETLESKHDTQALANFGAAMQSAMGIARAAESAGVSPVGHFFSGNLNDQSFPGLNVSAQEIQSINEIAQLLSLLPSLGYSGGTQSAGLQSVGNAINSIAASDTPTVGYDVLLHLLNKMQHEKGPSHQITDGDAPVSSANLLEDIAQQIQSEGEAKDNSIGRSERDTIGLVSMLFQFVIEDRVASKVLQRALSRLQLPVIKVALKDPRFFSNSEHPARVFLNSVTAASIGWVEREDYHSDPFYKQISEFIDYLIDEYEEDLEIFTEVTTKLQEFVDSEKERVERTERKLLDMENGRDKAEQSRIIVTRFIAEKIQQTDHLFVKEMLSDHWENYMLRLHLKGTESQEEYRDAARAINLLLWTLAPERCKIDAKTIAQKIPSVVKVLRAGFETLGMEVNRAGKFVRQLAAKHKEIMMREQPVVAPDITPIGKVDEQDDIAQPSITENHQVESNEVNLRLVADNSSISENAPKIDGSLDAQANEPSKIAAESTPDLESVIEEHVIEEHVIEEQSPEPQDSFEEQAESMAVGQWVEVIESHDKLRCRLAAILRASGKRVFVNRRGAKAVDMMIAELAEKLRDKTLILLDDGQLFDKALTSIIGDLRQQKRETVSISSS